jgi:hypothetical protein
MARPAGEFSMRRNIWLWGLLLLVPATAQAQWWEISGFAGYNQGGNAAVNPAQWRDAESEGGLILGGTLGYTYNEYFLLDLQYSWRQAWLTGHAALLTPREGIVELSAHELHLNFIYHLGYADAMTRPYLLLGAGVTQLKALGGRESEIRFSLGLGVGLKVWIKEQTGLKFETRYHPTYLVAEPGGSWCEPCVVMAEDNYLDEIQFSGGLVFRWGGDH